MQSAARHGKVLVVGAGPAGSAAALRLAQAGVDVVLIDRASFPRDKACGDGLMPGAVGLLKRMGIDVPSVASCEVESVRMTMRNGASRQYRFVPNGASGFVMLRRNLDQLLLNRAMAAGAEFRPGVTALRAMTSNGAVIGATVQDRNGRRTMLAADTVVVAEGSAGMLAQSAGLRLPGRSHRGLAARSYFTGLRDDVHTFDIVVPLRSASNPTPLAGYGWVFPVSTGVANVGVGLMPDAGAAPKVNIRRLFDNFVGYLRANDPRCRQMNQSGPLQGASLNCGFDARAVWHPGLLLVGDAAGLVDPFTGEGIQWALESGALAAELIAGKAAQGSRDLSCYGRLLEQRYMERFRFGRRLLDTRAFAWRLLEETFEFEAPLFSRLRRAMLDFGLDHPAVGYPRGLSVTGSHYPDYLKYFADAVEHGIESELADFPLLYRVVRNWTIGAGRRTRVAICALAAQWGTSDRQTQIRTSVCVELAYLGYLALRNVQWGKEFLDTRRKYACTAEKGPIRHEGPNPKWANAFAIMAGDFLLAKAYTVANELGPKVCLLLARMSANVCAEEASLKERGESPASPEQSIDNELLARHDAAFHVLACEISCELADVPSGARSTLVCFAEQIGTVVHLLADDVQRTPNQPAAIDNTGRYASAQASEIMAGAIASASQLPPTEATAQLFALAEELLPLA